MFKIHLNYIQGAREVSNHFRDNANFCLFIVGNLKDEKYYEKFFFCLSRDLNCRSSVLRSGALTN